MSDEYSLFIAEEPDNHQRLQIQIESVSTEVWKQMIKKHLYEHYKVQNKEVPFTDFTCMWMHRSQDVVTQWQWNVHIRSHTNEHIRDAWIPDITTHAGVVIPLNDSETRPIQLCIKGKPVRFDELHAEIKRIITIGISESVGGLILSGKAIFRPEHKERWEW